MGGAEAPACRLDGHGALDADGRLETNCSMSAACRKAPTSTIIATDRRNWTSVQAPWGFKSPYARTTAADSW